MWCAESCSSLYLLFPIHPNLSPLSLPLPLSLSLLIFPHLPVPCARSDGIALDGGNLKARYRRASAYFRLAHGECAPDRITYTTTEAEAASDDYWPLAMADVVSILEREPESAQAKALKKQIREGRTDQKRQRDLIRKYGRTLVDIPDAPGSVFQGFPAPPPADMRAKEAAAAATTTTNAPMRAAGPSMGGDKQERAQLQRAYETTVARDLAAGSLEGSSKDVLGNGSATTRGEAERQAAVRAELASAAGGAGVSFLDPMWKPPGQEAVGSGTTALLVPVASTRTAAAVAGSPAAAAAGVSFKDLLKGAADRKGKSKGKGDKSKDRKTLQPSAEVQSSLAALQEAEAAAAQAVERAAKDRELLAAQRARGNSRLERKSEQMQQEQRRLKKAPEVSSAWAELMQGESAAQNSYKQKVLSRPGGQVNLTS